HVQQRSLSRVYFFFFQAEDGIRDWSVTGVQTCALPICQARFETAGSLCRGRRVWVLAELSRDPVEVVRGDAVRKFLLLSNGHDRSEERRVGKEWRSRGSSYD